MPSFYIAVTKAKTLASPFGSFIKCFWPKSVKICPINPDTQQDKNPIPIYLVSSFN